ncbi:GNAT family N-acetyltransferase [Mycolicibacterium diernhoferi]|uniref:N-acetyltransferase n=1 Tax=Mycolicibacterium diernhoferi TaxID=1801 RepID=A0A1Q4H4I8_9MYCO|nr:GNAT family protein [Mycolicibacterium diernhoferi]OJZ62474.1 GNAT family N-acetyltransferase [Mycolicibacterium diernhoferi]OPE46557.1 GNAT family N-acetyltransferase [Mycolicibacterium diernhoferi]PEG52216.1 N-acetyltransferase [Mycolicibacterium diernhoferi]QYL22016.1 GNAT family N-acetyltransferase [Mycolicibacterium diernhoferi]
MSFVAPVTLTGGRRVTLEPLRDGHIGELAPASARAGSPWFTSVPTPDTTANWVHTRLADPAGCTFVVRGLDGAVIGSTSYLNIDGPNRRLEIGATWYVTEARRTGVNTEAKLLLLTHAFDALGCVAVEFRTHFFNTVSRTAIERLGAKQDGVLRSHQLLADGSRRDTVVYSILDIEWPAVRSNLKHRLDRTGSD